MRQLPAQNTPTVSASARSLSRRRSNRLASLSRRPMRSFFPQGGKQWSGIAPLAYLPRRRWKYSRLRAAPVASNSLFKSYSLELGLSSPMNPSGRTAANSRCTAAGLKGSPFLMRAVVVLIAVARSERARYAIDNPMQGTAEENKATAQGAMTYFGTYSVNEPDRIIYIHIDASSFPNWSGTDQQRSFTISQDQLKLTARALQTGGQAEVIWQRAK